MTGEGPSTVDSFCGEKGGGLKEKVAFWERIPHFPCHIYT